VDGRKSPHGTQGISRAFVNTLKELSAREALVLLNLKIRRIPFRGDELMIYCEGNQDAGSFMLANLLRLGLIAVKTKVSVPRSKIDNDTGYAVGRVEIDQEHTYYVTTYGRAFIEACQAPRTTQAPGDSQ
jgi:hypothetical protein